MTKVGLEQLPVQQPDLRIKPLTHAQHQRNLATPFFVHDNALRHLVHALHHLATTACCKGAYR